MSGKLPSFLIIGAMKAGTTTLYKDLLGHEGIFFPIDKEPGNLGHDFVLTQEGLGLYERLFRQASPGQICGDASTCYSKSPNFGGVPQRAKEVLGEKVKIIYLVRDPVERICSQHKHMYAIGRAPKDLGEALLDDQSYIDYSRYAYQLRSWLNHFDGKQVVVVDFSVYIRNRRMVVGEIIKFLGLSSNGRDCEVAGEKAYNQSSKKPRQSYFWKVIIKNPLYRRARKYIPPELRSLAIRILLPKLNVEEVIQSRQTCEWLAQEFWQDQDQLRELLSKGTVLCSGVTQLSGSRLFLKNMSGGAA